MILEAPNGVQPLAGVGWAWGWTVFNEPAAEVETDQWILFRVTAPPAHFKTTTSPAHFVTRTTPAHFKVEGR